MATTRQGPPRMPPSSCRRCTCHTVRARFTFQLLKPDGGDGAPVGLHSEHHGLPLERAPFDVKFFVDGTVFVAHKLVVVVARSDWFVVASYGHDGNKGADMTWVEE
jgi:hypothetical protein